MVLTTAVVTILYIVPLLMKRDKAISDLLLCAFLFTQGAIAVNIVLFYNETLGPQTMVALYPFQGIPFIVLYSIQGFLLYWYSKAMIGEPTNILSRSSFYGLLFALTLMISAVYHTSQNDLLYPYYNSAPWLTLPLSIILGVRALIRLKHYDNKIRQRFSTIENIRLSWLWFCSLGFVCVWGLVLISCILGNVAFATDTPSLLYLSKQIGTISNLPPMLLVSIMVVFGQAITLQNKDNRFENKDIQDKIFEATDEQKAKLDNLMLRVKIYQDPELRLDGLADCMDMSPRNVSALLNGHFQKSFYDFINHYRVRDAQEQLRNKNLDHKSVQRVFEDAGFNSKTNFITLFNKFTDYTPTEYRKTNSSSTPKELTSSTPDS
jgi:AraC-like DNA-binding protein